MSLVDSGYATPSSSASFSTSHFDYKTEEPIENSCKRNYSVPIRPLGSLDNESGQFTFIIEPQGTSYLQIDGVDIYLRLKIVRPDGTNMVAADVVAPVNNLFGALWEKIDIMFNDTTSIGQSAEYTDLKSILETILSYGGDARDNQLPSRMFYPDTPGQINNHSIDRGADNNNVLNEGFVMRHEKVSQSRSFEMFGPVCQSFFRTDKNLAPGNKLTMTFYLNNLKKLFCHDLGENRHFKIKFEEFTLKTWRIRNEKEFSKLKPGYLEKYNFTEGLVQCFTVPAGIDHEHLLCQHGGVIPPQMVVVQVAADAWAGDYTRNAYEFQNFNIKSTSLTINGEERPSQKIHFNFNHNNPIMLEGYNYTLQNIGVYKTNVGCSLNEDAFKTHHFIMVHDNTPDRCAGAHTHASDTGNVVLNIEWHAALEETTLIFVYNSLEAFYNHRTADLPFYRGIK